MPGNSTNRNAKRPRTAARGKGAKNPAQSQKSRSPCPSDNPAEDQPSIADPGTEHGDILKLKLEVCTLKQTVSDLTTKLNFVLSFLGIDEQCRNDPTNSNHSAAVDPSGAQAIGPNSTIDPAVRSQNSQSAPTKMKSYSDAVRVRLVDSMKSELLSAVHVELDMKSKRSSNVVIHGLPSTPETADSELSHVRDFLNVEFCTGVQRLNVVSCRRLGKRRGNGTVETDASTTAIMATPKKFQPLLVTLESSQQAKYVIDNARRLRKSVCEYTRDHIFINSDMTAAESKAAYEQRCRRREKQAARASTTAAGAADSRGGAMIVDDMISAVLSNARSRSDDVAATSTQPANGSSLDPAVQPFQPRPSSGVGSATSSSA
jgi:hypothetical protein